MTFHSLDSVLGGIALKRNFPTLIISLLCIIMYALSFCFGLVTFGSPEPKPLAQFVFSSFFYSFSHVNIIHLLINLLALYQFRPRLSTALIAFPISVLVPLLGVLFFSVPTCGISVFLYAAISRRYVAWHLPIYQPILSNLALCGINYIMHSTIYNWQAHLLAFSLGYVVWSIVYRHKQN